MSQKLEELQKYLEKMNRLGHVVTLLYWDMRTGMPKGGFEKHADAVAYFSTEQFQMSVAEELGNLLDALMVPEEFDTLDDTDDISYHAVAYNGDQPVGCGRMFPEAKDSYHIGRIAVLYEYRNKKLADTEKVFFVFFLLYVFLKNDMINWLDF